MTDTPMEADMYRTLEDEVFLAPESIIAGLLAAEPAEDLFEAAADVDDTAGAEALDLDALGV